MRNLTDYRFNFERHHLLFLLNYILLSIFLPIVSVIVANSTANSGCDNSSTISLYAYLIMTASFHFIIIFLGIIIAFFSLIDGYCADCTDCRCCGDTIENGRHGRDNCCWCGGINFVKFCRLVSIVLSTLYFCFAIVGCITLFRDSMGCTIISPLLFWVSVGVMLYYWISIVFNICFTFVFMKLE